MLHLVLGSQYKKYADKLGLFWQITRLEDFPFAERLNDREIGSFWRREDFSEGLNITYKEFMEQMEPDTLLSCLVGIQETSVINENRRSSNWNYRKYVFS